jgi:hypothetical protein
MTNNPFKQVLAVSYYLIDKVKKSNYTVLHRHLH